MVRIFDHQNILKKKMVKPEIKDEFVTSMLKFVGAVKGESEACSQICGGLNEKELFVVVFVGERKNVKMSDIADNLNAPLSTLTSIVDKLVERKFIDRIHSDEDRRVVNVSLSVKGKNVFRTFLKRKDEMAEKVLSAYSSEEQAVLVKHLNKLASIIVSMK